MDNIKVVGDAEGQWDAESVQKLLLLFRVAEQTGDDDYKDKALAGTDAVYNAMQTAFNPTLFDHGKGVTRAYINDDKEWKGHAWAVLLFWTAFDLTGNQDYRMIAIKHSEHLIEKHMKNKGQALSRRLSSDYRNNPNHSALAYHSLKRAYAKTNEAKFQSACENIRKGMLEAWKNGSSKRDWLIECLRVFEDDFYPYEDVE